MHQRREPENYAEYSVSQSLIHTLADVQLAQIGSGTRVWQFDLHGAENWPDGNICSHSVSHSEVVLGDRVTITTQAKLWDRLRVDYDMSIDLKGTFANDKFLHSMQFIVFFAKVIITVGEFTRRGGGDTASLNDWRTYNLGRSGSSHALHVLGCRRRGKLYTHRRICWGQP